jgi:2-phosphosulfolactate phosphatase
MTLDVVLSPAELEDKGSLKNTIVLVADIFRASATMCMMLSKGAIALVLFESVQAALEFHNNNPDENSLLAGEQGGLLPVGFDLGNSPIEIQSCDFYTKTIRYVTTNGTTMLRRTGTAAHQIVASFVNLDSVVSFVNSQIQNSNSIDRILVCCAGNNGGFSLEDSFFAGRFMSRYIAPSSSYELTDAAKAAICIANSYTNNINDLIRDARHAQLLIEYGFADDVSFCLKENAVAVVPVCRNGIVSQAT